MGDTVFLKMYSEALVDVAIHRPDLVRQAALIYLLRQQVTHRFPVQELRKAFKKSFHRKVSQRTIERDLVCLMRLGHAEHTEGRPRGWHAVFSK